MATSTLTRKGQTTIPKAVRERLGLKPGDAIEFVEAGEHAVLMRPLKTSTLGELFAIVPPIRRGVTLEEMQEAIELGATRGEEG